MSRVNREKGYCSTNTSHSPRLVPSRSLRFLWGEKIGYEDGLWRAGCHFLRIFPWHPSRLNPSSYPVFSPYKTRKERLGTSLPQSTVEVPGERFVTRPTYRKGPLVQSSKVSVNLDFSLITNQYRFFQKISLFLSVESTNEMKTSGISVNRLLNSWAQKWNWKRL